MTDQLWYYAVNNQREGPVSDGDLRQKIAAGEIRADTLVWNQTMKDWTRAGDVPGLMAQPPAGGLPPALATGGQEGAPLQATVRTWPLFGRGLLVIIGSLLIIPAPWVWTSLYRWFIDHIDLPNARKVGFAGQPGDIWYIFMLNALLGYGGVVHQGVPILLLPVSALFALIIVRWMVRNLRWEDQTEALQFTGSYWGVLGWQAFLYVSLISIIGWAWVLTAQLRWYSRNFTGTNTQLSFVGSGWGVLWRSIVFVLLCFLVIPIPWILAWYTRWFVSQFHLSARA